MFGGGVAQRQTRKLRSKARRGIPERLPLTIAGVALPFEDEFKHFKCIRTTGTGTSTVIRELLHAALKAILSIWMRLAIFQTMSMGEGDHRLWFAMAGVPARSGTGERPGTVPGAGAERSGEGSGAGRARTRIAAGDPRRRRSAPWRTARRV